MYFFHSHNIVGCLASIGGFWENDTYTQGGTFVVLIVNRPQRSPWSLFFSSFIFLLCNITGEKKITAITARSLAPIFITKKKEFLNEQTNKPIKMQLPLLLLAAMAR